MIDYSLEHKQFIKQNIERNTEELALEGVPFFILEQIKSRQKAKNKLPFLYDNYDVLFPKPISIEQSSSEKTAKYKASISEGSKAIDLTGGFGIDSIYLCKNFKEYVYNELNKELSSVFQYNLDVLGITNIEMASMKAEDLIKDDRSYDLIYIDPSRRDGEKKTYELEDCEPNILDMIDLMIKRSKIIMIKLSPMVNIERIKEQLGTQLEIHCLLYQNEVKEILAILGSESKLIAVDLDSESIREFPENSLTEKYRKDGEYIFLPKKHYNKLGVQDIVASQLGYYKVNQITNVYFGLDLPDKLNEGRFFRIKERHIASKAIVKKHLYKKRYSIITKNYPEKAQDLRNKYKVGESEKDYAILYKDSGKKHLLIAERV